MRPHGTWRTVRKWIGTALCLLLAVLFAVVKEHCLEWRSPAEVYRFASESGSIRFSILDEYMGNPRNAGWRFGPTVIMWDGYSGRPRWRDCFRCPEVAIGRYFEWPEFVRHPGESLVVTVPIWMLFICVALPTVLFWCVDRRRPRPGHCRCGYNLSGNVSGRSRMRTRNCRESRMSIRRRTDLHRALARRSASSPVADFGPRDELGYCSAHAAAVSHLR